MYVAPPACHFDFFVPDCDCDPIDIEWNFELMRTYRKNPEKALCRACGCRGKTADGDLLKAITTLVVQEEGARTVRLAQHLTRMILEGYSLPASPVCEPGAVFRRKRCHWELPLVGLHNLLVAIRRDGKSGLEDCAIVGQICSDYQKILDVVVKDLAKLLPAGPHADHLRNTVVKTLSILADDMDFRNTLLYDEQAMELILTCWTHMSAPNRDDVNALVHKFYEDHGGCRACSIDPDRHERAVHIIGVDTLIQKFEEWLTTPSTLDESLRLELHTIYDFLSDTPSYGKPFSAAKTYNHVVTAMRRQKQHGNPESTCNIFHLGFSILTILTIYPECTAFPKVNDLPPGTVDLATSALFLDMDTREAVLPPPEGTCRYHSGYRAFEETGYYMHLAEILNYLECDCRKHGERLSPSFVDECRAQTEQHLIPVFRHLVVRGYERNLFAKDAYSLWKRWAIALDISEAGLRKKWLEEGDCWNPWCPNRGDKSVKKKRCARCHGVMYCSNVCQKADWKEHKAQCASSRTRR